ncbi:hypothetical protein JYU04_04060 [Dehalococcoides mccartyi]|nr:hypothetical protein [Dehalococcoides mccartyi]
MPFFYTPSIYGFAGALIFFILALTSLNNDGKLIHTAMWALLGAAYLLKHLPKFLILRMLNMVALALLAIGLVLFLIEHLPNING